MKANFDSPLPRKSGDAQKVDASGPLVWDTTPPVEACTVSATITQTNGSGAVIGTGVWNRDYQAGDPKWDGEVRTRNGEFAAGLAYATGIITVTQPGTAPSSQAWSQWVTLT
jgi:hypothetical protein